MVYTVEEYETLFSAYSSEWKRRPYLFTIRYPEDVNLVMDPDEIAGKVNDYKTIGNKNSVIPMIPIHKCLLR